MLASVSEPEKHATSPASARTQSSSTSIPAPAPKLRSCVTCRHRKVRCDKQSPCSNCRRANIACVSSSTDRPPRWARRLERLNNNNNAVTSNATAPPEAGPDVVQVMDRLRNLENLVKELSGQLEQAHAAAASSAGDGSSELNSPGSSTQDRDADNQRGTSPATTSSSVQKQFGRLVVQDANRSRYISSGFWSRVNDELDGLKMETSGLLGDDFESSDDEALPSKTPSAQEHWRTPSERHAFLFRHNLSPLAPNLHEFHPLPSQIPFLLDVFSENVNFICQIVHMPTVTKMFRDLRGNGMTHLKPATEALMFSIYYAAIISMEGDEVMTNFGSSKTDLSLKYRLGLEHALAKADFLNVPDITLVQAFAIFLKLVRRHDSPRFVWMMTGLVIRMAQYLGLQRDGSHFEHLTPFEIEMRRRVWWCVCMLDLRASEDQGTDLTITSGSFDTKIPLNINDGDIDPGSNTVPAERDGVTDMSFGRIMVGTGEIMRQMMTRGVRDGAAGLEDQSRLLNELYQKFEQGFLQYPTDSGNIAYWVGTTIARLVLAKMTLIVYLPVLFSSASEHLSDGIRTKLLISAIEVAEYNHALNAEQAARKWRWIYQTYTHWHAIVYLMIEISQRPWSPTVERAWVALHSSWLIPAQSPEDKKLRIWVPLRMLMDKAFMHRDAELNRLRADPQAAARLEREDLNTPLPSSSGPFSTGSSVEIFRERWRQLVTIQERSGEGTQTSGIPVADPSTNIAYTSQPTAGSISAYGLGDLGSSMTSEPTYLGTSGQQQVGQILESNDIRALQQAITTDGRSELAMGKSGSSPYPTVPAHWSDDSTMGPGSVPWLWADTDPSNNVFSNLDFDSSEVNMDLNGEMNWYDWVESAKGMESWDSRAI